MTAPGRLTRRLNRILLLLPYVIAHPGVSLDELSETFGIDQERLRRDLELIWFCGLPGYTPADLIDVTIEGDRVFVTMADYFDAPLRLTPAEGLALYAGGAAIAELPEMQEADALRRALEKLGRALGAGREGGDPSGLRVKLEPGPIEHIDALTTAIENKKRVRLDYFSATSAELTSREVDPWGMVAALGRLYLVAWDHSNEDERIFRTDRIKHVDLLDEDADVPTDFDPDRYRGAFSGEGPQRMTMEISPQTARWFEEYYPVQDSKTLRGGWRRVQMVIGGDAWGAMLVLRLGDQVRAVEPPSVVEAARALAARVAARY